MKKIGIVLCLLITLSIVTVSCGKDVPEPGEVPTGPVNTGPTGPTGPTGG